MSFILHDVVYTALQFSEHDTCCCASAIVMACIKMSKSDVKRL